MKQETVLLMKGPVMVGVIHMNLVAHFKQTSLKHHVTELSRIVSSLLVVLPVYCRKRGHMDCFNHTVLEF